MKKITTSAPGTIKFARQFASKIKSSQVLALVGDLGIGKTQFVKGLAQGLGISQSILSPTFVLFKPYPIDQPDCPLEKLIHVDCYRLSSPQELLALGWGELITDKNNLVVVEWADKIKNILPRNTTWIKFTKGKSETDRQITIN